LGVKITLRELGDRPHKPAGGCCDTDQASFRRQPQILSFLNRNLRKPRKMRLVRPGTYTVRLLASGLLCAFLALVAGCSGGGGSGGPGALTASSPPTIKSIKITPANSEVAAGIK